MSASTAGLIFYLISALSLACFLYLLRKQKNAASWPSVAGVVLDSSVETDADNNSYPTVRYKYIVRGAEFIGDNLYPHGRLATSGSYAEKSVAKYAPGARIRVHYNPQKPSVAFLEASVPNLVLLMLVAAILVFATMGAVLRG